MNDNTIKILEDELKRAEIRLDLVCRAHYDAYTTERFCRRELKEAQEKNEPREVIERMSSNLERAIAITKEANAMIDEAEERRRIVLQAINEHNIRLNSPLRNLTKKLKQIDLWKKTEPPSIGTTK